MDQAAQRRAGVPRLLSGPEEDLVRGGAPALEGRAGRGAPLKRVPAAWPAALLAVLGLLAACSAKPPAWAPAKARLCAACDASRLPFNLPSRGLALGFGRRGSPNASWIVVDLDRRALNRLTTWFDIQSNTTSLMSRKEEPLGKARAGRVIELANAVWSSDVPVPEERGTGVVWDLYLFDGKDIRHDMGGGRPGGAAAELEAVLESPPSS